MSGDEFCQLWRLTIPLESLCIFAPSLRRAHNNHYNSDLSVIFPAAMGAMNFSRGQVQVAFKGG